MVYLFCGLTIISLCSGESERGADIHVEKNIFSEAPASCTHSHTMTPGCLSMYLFFARRVYFEEIPRGGLEKLKR